MMAMAALRLMGPPLHAGDRRIHQISEEDGEQESHQGAVRDIEKAHGHREQTGGRQNPGGTCIDESQVSPSLEPLLCSRSD